MKSVEFHPEARLELKDSSSYYEARRPNLGVRFLNRVEQSCEMIQAFPLSGSEFLPTVRRGLVQGFPFQVIYKIYDELILIVAIAHTSRKPGYWSNRI